MIGGDKKPLVSVIVPVYNVRQYLARCINSILVQIYENIEIILVDDGSTDGSGEICDEYAKKDERIKVYHKENGGLSDARNYGIERASGEYITFVDSDDYVSVDCVSTLYGLIEKYKTKIAVAGCQIKTKRKEVRFGQGSVEECLSTAEALRRMLTEDGFTVSAWAKIYHKELFKNIRFPVGALYEDNAVTYKLFMQCSKIAYANKVVYCYVIRKDAITTQDFTEKKMDYIKWTDIACEDILKVYPELENECQARQIVARLSVLRQMLETKELDEKMRVERDRIIRHLRQNYSEFCKNPALDKKTKYSLLTLKYSTKALKLGATVYEKFK